MDTAFAKIVTDMDGRDHILIEGRIISLKIGDKEANNEVVAAFTRSMRRGGTEIIMTGGGAVQGQSGEQSMNLSQSA